jgi:ATP-dependent DNA helicase RecG
LDDTVNDTVNDTVKKRLVEIIKILKEKPRMKSSELAAKLEVTEVTIRRDIQKISKLVKFEGAPKSGGYVLTEFMQQQLKDIE